MLIGKRIGTSIGSVYWCARFSTWPPPIPAHKGYTLLLPVPGDLPVFLDVALAVCAGQDASSRLETIIVPDRPSPAIRSIHARWAQRWVGDLSVELLPLPERLFLPLLGNPSHNYGTQLITGVSKARGSHVILHDADLFLLSPQVLERHYRAAVDQGLNVCGVSPVWDGWFAERGLGLVATWELCARRNWLRGFPPHMHMGHVGEILGQRHVFDATLQPQALTDPATLAVHPLPEEVVHFNYVIGSYRHFKRARGGFVDRNFRLLFVRLLIDLFDSGAYKYGVPRVEELARGLRESNQAVSYLPVTPDSVREYHRFRANMSRILAAPSLADLIRTRLPEALDLFDEFYEFTGPTSSVTRE